MTGLYKRLRNKMKAQGVTQAHLQMLIGYAKNSRYMSDRLTGRIPFEADRMYTIMDALHIPHDEMHLYFPPNGIEMNLSIEKKPVQSVAPMRLIFELVEGNPATILQNSAISSAR